MLQSGVPTVVIVAVFLLTDTILSVQLGCLVYFCTFSEGFVPDKHLQSILVSIVLKIIQRARFQSENLRSRGHMLYESALL